MIRNNYPLSYSKCKMVPICLRKMCKVGRNDLCFLYTQQYIPFYILVYLFKMLNLYRDAFKIGQTLLWICNRNKRAQRALGRSPEEKVKSFILKPIYWPHDLLIQPTETVSTTLIGDHTGIIPVKFGQIPISG